MNEAKVLLELDSLRAGYSGVPAVRDLSLKVRSGEVVAMLGPNGAGKTTTLSTVAGLLKPIDGTIKFDGEDISGRPAHWLARRGVAMVPEGRALFYEMTARENLKLAPGSKDALTESEVIEILPELEKCLGRNAGVLSGGEQQMLAVGRALISRPRLLLVDEMSLGLAPIIVERLLPLLRRVADDFGAAVLFVEQHVPLALEVADHAYVLNHGNLVMEGEAKTLYRDKHLLQASYLGEAQIDDDPASTAVGEA
ncbi:MAG: ABC transporter ATP-binding protein [Solirubrobacterales bacterium]